MRTKGHKIKSVDPDSIAEELELEPGDEVLTIDGQELEDIFDYEYYINSDSLVMTVRKEDGEEWELEIEHNYEDLGITFENGLMSDYRSCSNRCVFCFIDQMPPGMRNTLYFKDDDSRLSFLQGNYVTLTNLSDHDVERIIEFKLSPINISVQTTNPELRCKMLHNRFAGDSLRRIDQLYEAQTPMNGQVVLCKGLNDREELDRTIRDLSRYLPYMESVSVVPVGLSKFRDGLYPLQSITTKDAIAAIDLIESWQKKIYEKHHTHFVHASDEFYILAGRSLPEEERYDGYIQLENGVGMLRLLEEEVNVRLEELDIMEKDRDGMLKLKEASSSHHVISIATGKLAYPFICRHVKRLEERFPSISVHVYGIANVFFGEQITVAGLLTGQDLMNQLKHEELGERLLLPECMFRSGEEVFLDDITREEVQKALQVQIDIVKSSGQDLVDAILGLESSLTQDHYQAYELQEN